MVSVVHPHQCTIEGMTNSDSSTSINDETPDLPTTPETRTQALNRLREAENQRLDVERVVRKRLMWLGIVVGATVGLTVGYLGTLITIVDNSIGEFGFQFYRPNFIESFLRIITAYILAGGAVGGALSYVLFTTRSEASSPIRWLIAGIIYALGTPLLIGFLLPLTILIFVDFFEGLRPGLWISAFVETLLGSFLDGYIYMVKVLSAGVAGAVLFLIIFNRNSHCLITDYVRGILVSHDLIFRHLLRSCRDHRPHPTRSAGSRTVLAGYGLHVLPDW